MSETKERTGVPVGKAPGARFWALKQSALRNDVLQLYIYGDVEGNYWDWWTGQEIESDTSAEHFRQELAQYPNASEIEIYINSYGGEVFEGTAIYNQLKRHPAHKTVYIDGFACSIASVIAMAGDEIVMPRNTLMMIHNMWMGAVGNAAALRKAADDLDVINAAGRQAYLLKAGDKLTEEKLTELMDAETWLTAQDCIDLGLADRFADTEADMSTAAAAMQRVNLNLEQQLKHNRDLCASLRQLQQREAEPQPAAPEEKTPSAAEEAPRKPSLMELLAGVQI